ncbi:hypothetical protein [Halosimplex marinum]|uniref:hypothetical protein n=1 Tax=Halosimplex marinum TaxID=3396620 RepID=UPI003F5466EA
MIPTASLERESGFPGPEGAQTAAGHRQELVDADERPECPDRGSLSLYYAERRETRESCGRSEW